MPLDPFTLTVDHCLRVANPLSFGTLQDIKAISR